VDHHLCGSPAESFLACSPVDAAAARAKLAFFEDGERLLDAVGELAFFFQLDVSGLPFCLPFGWFYSWSLSLGRACLEKHSSSGKAHAGDELSTCHCHVRFPFSCLLPVSLKIL